MHDNRQMYENSKVEKRVYKTNFLHIILNIMWKILRFIFCYINCLKQLQRIKFYCNNICIFLFSLIIVVDFPLNIVLKYALERCRFTSPLPFCLN